MHSLPQNFLNKEIFEQLLEIGEDDPDFLKGLIASYMDQAQSTLKNMDEALYDCYRFT